MADKKISALTASTTPLAGTEVLPIVQGGSTVKVSVSNLTAGRDVATQNVTTTSGRVQINYDGSAGAPMFDLRNSNGTQWELYTPTSDNSLKLDVWVPGQRDSVFSIQNAAGSHNITVSTGNVVIGTAGKGIDFSANTHAAGMTSELLNWYEEGTWTGGISFGGGSTGITYANNVGYYTRIGNIVTVSCYLVLSNKGSSTGAARITGLPFTCVNNASGYSALSVLPLNVTFTGQLSGYANINDTTVDLVPSTGVALTDTGFANNSTFIISLTYRAA